MVAKTASRRCPACPPSDNSIWLTSLGLALLMATGMGCNSAAKKATGGTGGGAGHIGETGSGGGAGSGVDAPTECHQALGALTGGCPALYGDDSWKEPVCRQSPSILQERSCDTYRSRSVGLATHGYTCYYENTRNTLVGARVYNDSPAFCDNTSFTVIYGDIRPSDACAAPVDLHDTCVPDGGAADGRAADGGVEGGGGSDGAPQDTGHDSAVCRGGQADALAPVGPGCPLSFTGTACLHSIVAPYDATVQEQRCDGYRWRSYGFGIFGYKCYYDPTALTLVAAEYFDDTPRFCNGSFGITYGTIPPAGTCDPATPFPKPCAADAAAD